MQNNLRSLRNLDLTFALLVWLSILHSGDSVGCAATAYTLTTYQSDLCFPSSVWIQNYTSYLTNFSDMIVLKKLNSSSKATPLVGKSAAFANSADSNGDNGPTTNATLNSPWNTILDNSGNLYISDFEGNRVRKVDALTNIITTLVGDGYYRFNGDGYVGNATSLANPANLWIDSSNYFYIADTVTIIGFGK